MKRLIPWIFLLLPLWLTDLAAQPGTDTLEEQLLQARGLERVRHTNRLAASHLDASPARTITYALQALQELRAISNQIKELRKSTDPTSNPPELPDAEALMRAEAISHNLLGRAYRKLEDTKKAIEHFRLAYRFSRRSGYREGEDVALAHLREMNAGRGLGILIDESLESTGIKSSVREAKVEINVKYLEGVARVHEEKGRYQTAIDQYIQMIRFYEARDDSLKLAEVYSRIAVLQNELGDQEKAMSYYELAAKVKGRGTLPGNESRRDDIDRIPDAPRIRIPAPPVPDLTSKQGLQEPGWLVMGPASGNTSATESSPAFKESYDRLKKQLEVIYAQGQSDSLIRAMMIHEQRIRIDSLQQERERQLLVMEQQEAEMRRRETQQIALIGGLLLILIIAGVLYALFLTKKRSHKRLASAYNKLDAAHQQLKATQIQLVEAEKMASLGQLTAGIAHEINNPLNFISANISPLRRDIDDLMLLLDTYEAAAADLSQMPKARQMAHEMEIDYLREEITSLLLGIEEGASRTAEIVQGLRDFSRLDENMPKAFDIHGSLDDTLSILRNRYEGRILIEKKYAADLPAITGLVGKINQVLLHILQNAIEAISGEGTISIETLRTGNRICISIRDNGKGMEPVVLRKAFDPFFTTKDVGQGKGLGLAICHGIVRQHKGDIELRSEPGKGTVAEVFLPVEERGETAALSETRPLR